MANKSPVFPMPDPQHYSDYGFDPQIDYFQVLEEARRHSKKEARSLDAVHFKLQKPILKEERTKTKKRRWWWRNAFVFWKWRKGSEEKGSGHLPGDVTPRAYPYRAVSGPVYLTESSGSSTPCRSSRANSGPLRATETGEVEIPYLSLRNLSLIEGHRISNSAPPSMPIYLVT